MIGKLAASGAEAGKNNVAFMAHFLRGETDACLDLLLRTDRLPEAAFLARTRRPARLPPGWGHRRAGWGRRCAGWPGWPRS